MQSFIYIALCLAVVAVFIKPLGKYIARVFMGRKIWLEKPLGWLERGIYKICGIDASVETCWVSYSKAVLVFSLFSFLVLYLILLFQNFLPLNPQGFSGLSPDLAFNAAISFITNSNWQSYSGEVALSNFSQTAGLTIQNFLSAATGMAVAATLVRGIARKQMATIGNFYVDLVRGTLYILLPASLIFAMFLASQGVPQSEALGFRHEALEAPQQTSSQAISPKTQAIPQGLVASQVAIKMLGSNGGGYFNANGAHPLENPTSLSNFFQIVAILLIPAAFAYSFGVMVGDKRQGWMLVFAMTMIFIPLLTLGVVSEIKPNPHFDANIVDVSAGNMEGKEVRFGVASSALWAAATSATSNGSVNSMHDSFSPLGGLVPLMLIQFGEVIFGGVGSGLYGMMMFVILTVFIGGLMVGRTPEYLGKKIGVFEIKMASIVILIPAMVVLIGTAIAVSTEAGRAGILNGGAQGFSEILYAFASAGNNNGSAFAGLSANTEFYNIALGIAMFVGRYFIIIPVLAIAGSLAAKNITPNSAGTMPTHTPLFTSMLVGVVVLIGVLTYVPALALGPIAEHLHLSKEGAK
jgi:K+-transporting ATPase ATPase A chain